MAATYTLYGSYASYYTAKVRAYLRKKGIPFVERLPSDPLFRSTVRPASGSHRIPQLLTPDSAVLQDSVEILDYLEARFPAVPAFPETPHQRTFVHLMELLGSEGLLRLAWLHRWLFEDNDRFVKMDFGRSFKPQGDDATLVKYGELISERMRSYGLPESTPAARAALEEKYGELLTLFDAHLIEHPYLLGGHPSAADYAVMGALHAHLGRDPAGLRTMQNRGPRTFRWVEHMLVPELASPEFFDRPVEYLADDEVPQTALAILQFIAQDYGEPFVLGALAYNQAMDGLGASSGHQLAPEIDQPTLAAERVSYQGTEVEPKANLYAVWLTQRAQRFVQSQSSTVQASIAELLGAGVAAELVAVPLRYPINRVDNRLVIQ